MKKMTFCLLSLLLITIFGCITLASCKKHNDNQYLNNKSMDTTDTIQLLTAAPWKFLSYEYDYNSDAEIDTGEENIDDCKKQISTYSNASVTKIDRNKLIPTDTNEEPVKLITIYEH